MFDNEPNELTLIFNSNKPDDERTRAYVETLSDYVIKTIDIKREKLTETQLAELADKLGDQVPDLVDESFIDQTNAKSTTGMSSEDILTLLSQEPILVNTPILIIGRHAFKYVSAYDLVKEGSVTEGVEDNAAANAEERPNP